MSFFSFVKKCGAEFSSFRSTALKAAIEVFEEASLQSCAANCAPDSKDAEDYVGESEEDVAESIADCVADCYDITDATARSAATGAAACAFSCAETAADKFDEVSNKCAKMKSTNCKKGNDCSKTCEADDKSCEKKVKKCLNEFEECEDCADEVEDSKKSVKKVGSELNKW